MYTAASIRSSVNSTPRTIAAVTRPCHVASAKARTVRATVTVSSDDMLHTASGPARARTTSAPAAAGKRMASRFNVTAVQTTIAAPAARLTALPASIGASRDSPRASAIPSSTADHSTCRSPNIPRPALRAGCRRVRARAAGCARRPAGWPRRRRRSRGSSRRRRQRAGTRRWSARAATASLLWDPHQARADYFSHFRAARVGQVDAVSTEVIVARPGNATKAPRRHKDPAEPLRARLVA